VAAGFQDLILSHEVARTPQWPQENMRPLSWCTCQGRPNAASSILGAEAGRSFHCDKGRMKWRLLGGIPYGSQAG
jgi:hypothetical protein